MDKFQAAFEVLCILSMIDGEVHDKEIEVINQFVHNNVGKSNFDTRAVFQSLAIMTPKGRVEELASVAVYIGNNCNSLEKRNILESALALIAADRVLKDEEVTAFVLLGNTWGIDIQAFMAQYK